MATYVVTDAVMYPDANGTYTEAGTYNGKPYYQKDTYYIAFDGSFGDQWYISAGGIEFWYQAYWTYSSDATPPLGSWSGYGDSATVAGGGPPPPPPPETVLLLHFNGTGTTFTDETTRHTPTAIGNATQSADQSVFGGKSLSLPDTSSYFSVTDTLTDLKWSASGQATLDFRIRFTGEVGTTTFFRDIANDSNDLYYVGGKIYMRTNTGGGGSANWDWTPSLNTWYHFAMVKETTSADAIKIYIDGNALTRNTGTFTTGLSVNGGGMYFFQNGSGYTFTGYIDELRWSTVARWTENFTPPAVEYSLGNVTGPFPVFFRT